MRKRILFICTHNSARSQIAEGLTNYLFGNQWSAFSAGTEKTKVNPIAIKAMEVRGIDISSQRSKSINEFAKDYFDIVVTVCDQAKETCPFFPNAKKLLHTGFEDPSLIEGSEEEKLRVFAKTVKEIELWLKETLSNPIS